MILCNLQISIIKDSEIKDILKDSKEKPEDAKISDVYTKWEEKTERQYAEISKKYNAFFS